MLTTVNFAKTFAKIKQPILLVGNDEFLKQDLADTFASHWRNLGYLQSSIKLNSYNDWLELDESISHNSLFAINKVIICHLNQKSLPKKSEELFVQKLANLGNNIKLLFLSNKLGATFKKSKILPVLSVVTIWPLKANELVAWGMGQAQALKLQLKPEQLQTLIHKSDFCPITIKNNLRILAVQAEQNPDLALLVSNNKHKDSWQIIESAMIGDTKSLLHNLQNFDSRDYMSLQHACFYTIDKITAIADLINSGLTTDSAVSKLVNWPKQRQMYTRVLQRQAFDWHRIKAKAIALDLAFKGSNTSWDAGKELELLLLAICDQKFCKFVL